ncbi:MAG: hypothetical protein AB1716_11390 [Planctomycetota bacterium]
MARKPRSEPRHETGWLSRADMCAVWDVSEQVFDRNVRPHFPPEAVRIDGGRLWFYARACLDAWAARLATGGEDPLLCGGESPALEEYRRERAALARLDRLEREGSLLQRDQVHGELARLAAAMRAAGERVARISGDAAEVLTDALDDFDRGVKDKNGQNGKKGKDARNTPA